MGNITFSSPQVLIHFTYISKLNQPFLFSWRRQSLSLSADFSSKLRNLVITKDNGNGAWSRLTCKTVLEWAYKFVKLHICHGVYHVCPSDCFPGKYIVNGCPISKRKAYEKQVNNVNDIEVAKPTYWTSVLLCWRLM